MIMKRFALALFLPLTITAAFASNDVNGIVVDASSKALPGATVYVYTASPKVGVSPFCPSCYRDCGKHEPVNAEGRFRLKALDPKLRFDLLAVADGYEPSLVRHIDPMGGLVTIKLTPRSIADADRLIVGVVVDPHGKPVVGAAVEPNGYRFPQRGVGYGNIPGVDKLSFTNAKGEFALRIPDADGKLDVRVTARSLAPHIERMLAPGESRTIPLTEGATITGRVMRGRKPVSGARVGFIQTDRASSGYLGRFEIGTNDDGVFLMTNMGPNQSYAVYAAMEGLSGGAAVRKIVNVAGDKTTTDAGTLAVQPGRRIAGTVVVPEGTSIPPHTQIILSLYVDSDSQRAELRPDGRFSFEGVPPGGAELDVYIPGLELTHSLEARFGGVSLPTEGDVKDVRVVLERK
jgi:hypothetical protein